jgi:hypothetical protein
MPWELQYKAKLRTNAMFSGMQRLKMFTAHEPQSCCHSAIVCCHSEERKRRGICFFLTMVYHLKKTACQPQRLLLS